jgi:hypothetical protein
MRYQIPTIPDEDLDIAISAEIGAESRVLVSYEPGRLLADLEQEAVDDGTIVFDRTYRAPEVTSVGRDLQLICNGAVLSNEEIVVVLNVMMAGIVPGPLTITGNTAANPSVVTTGTHGLTSGQTVTITGSNSTPTLNGPRVVTVLSSTTFSVPVTVTVAGTAGSVQGPVNDVATTATATFSPPGTAQDASFNFPPGLGVDFIVDGNGNENRTIRSIVSVDEVSGGRAGNKFFIMALPNRDSYTQIMCATDKSIPIPVGKSVSIPCGFDGSRWVKKGRSEAVSAEFTAKYGSVADGLARVNGHRVTVMVETHKDDRILTERLVLTGWRPVVSIKKGDGEAEAEASASGMYEVFAGFV